MHGHDLHNSVKVQRAISPVAIGTTGTGQSSVVIDRQGFGGVEFIISVGAITATDATVFPTVKEGDATGALTSVADTDLVGTELLATVGQATPRTSGVSMNLTTKIGYKGTKRYVGIDLDSTITAGTLVAVDAVLFNPESTSALT